MPRNALVTPLVTRDSNAVGALRNALVTAPRPNPSRPGPVCKDFMAEPVSDRRSADARESDDLTLAIHEGEAR